jgi:hypothetical protein
MTIVADDKKSVALPGAKPGDRFDLQVITEGKILLTPLGASPAQPTSVRIEKKDGFTVGVLDRPIDEKALSEALNEFP